ncbi:MAG: hypothetical protein EOO47_00045 [Flavobacterium sp.]|nr:MAG: hypothetical protein EOO47_00045 [Flavobacterium sp.]
MKSFLSLYLFGISLCLFGCLPNEKRPQNTPITIAPVEENLATDTIVTDDVFKDTINTTNPQVTINDLVAPSIIQLSRTPIKSDADFNKYIIFTITNNSTKPIVAISVGGFNNFCSVEFQKKIMVQPSTSKSIKHYIDKECYDKMIYQLKEAVYSDGEIFYNGKK